MYCLRVCTFPGVAAAREARREKREEITKKAARDTQMKLLEQQQLTDKVCLGARFAPFLQGRKPRGLIIPCKNAGILFRASSAEARSDDGAEKREKREERREKREERKWPPARFIAFLRCPVPTSKKL